MVLKFENLRKKDKTLIKLEALIQTLIDKNVISKGDGDVIKEK